MHQVRVFGEWADERVLVHELEAGLLGFVPLEQSGLRASDRRRDRDHATTDRLIARVARLRLSRP